MNSLTVSVNAFVLKMGKLRQFFFGLWITILSVHLKRNSDSVLSDAPISVTFLNMLSCFNMNISKYYKNNS